MEVDLVREASAELEGIMALGKCGLEIQFRGLGILVWGVSFARRLFGGIVTTRILRWTFGICFGMGISHDGAFLALRLDIINWAPVRMMGGETKDDRQKLLQQRGYAFWNLSWADFFPFVSLLAGYTF